MFFDEDRDGRERVVVHFTVQPSGRSLDDDMLVHFVIAAAGIGVGQLFVTA